MLKQSITYENYDGEQVTEICYFHYSRAEIAEKELDPVNSLSARFRKVINEKEPKQVMAFVKDLILDSYGQRTPNGGFLKNQQLRDEFAASEAYSELILSLVQDGEKLGKFFEGVMPKQMIENAKKMHLENQDELINKFKNGDAITPEDLSSRGLNVNN